MSTLEKLVTIFEMSEKLGYNLEGLTVSEWIQLQEEIIDCIEQAQINSDNK